MENPFDEILKRLDEIKKLISPAINHDKLPIVEKQNGKQVALVKISVASKITGYSVNYLYHLASTGAIPCVKRGRSLRFDMVELQEWMQQQYVSASKDLSHEKRKK